MEIAPRTFQRWLAATPRVPGARGRPRLPPPTPAEVWAVEQYAHRHPRTGYKRLTAELDARRLAFLRKHQVEEILKAAQLLGGGGNPPAGALKRPPPPERPDQVWHIDLMYLLVGRKWFYLVDILDGYSRYLVHWTLNPTMLAETVTLTVQQALEQLSERRPEEPQIVHDRGSQFVSGEWKGFVRAAGCRDIRTRVAHPESNGKLERLHRTHREEGLVGAELTDYHAALEAMQRWASYYNQERPHSALKYLQPVTYYRGDPGQELRAREQRLTEAAAARKAYWEERPA